MLQTVPYNAYTVKHRTTPESTTHRTTVKHHTAQQTPHYSQTPRRTTVKLHTTQPTSKSHTALVLNTIQPTVKRYAAYPQAPLNLTWLAKLNTTHHTLYSKQIQCSVNKSWRTLLSKTDRSLSATDSNFSLPTDPRPAASWIQRGSHRAQRMRLKEKSESRIMKDYEYSGQSAGVRPAHRCVS